MPPIKIKVKFQIKNNPIGIPPNSFIDMIIEIIDEYETIWTSNARFTQDLVRAENLKPTCIGNVAKYIERNQRAVVYYPKKTQKEIVDIVSADLKKIGAFTNG